MATASIGAWATLPSGARVDAVTLSNAAGMSVKIATWGATILSVRVPSKAGGAAEEVTLCYADLETLRAKSPYYGATVGRVANRIAGGAFELNGRTHALARNNGAHHLHGGVSALDKALWTPRVWARAGAAGADFSYRSHDGEEGYPGNLDVTVTYSLTDASELVMEFAAKTDAATPINLCNHTYWNLSGDLRADIKDHVLTLPGCAHVLEADGALIPTGKILPVAGTAFDFTAPKRIGAQLADVDGGGEKGYDHCFTRAGAGAPPTLPMPAAVIAVLEEPKSGRRMTVTTDQPGVQLYTGNFLSKDAAAAPHAQHGALCLETENHPDAVHHAHFPSSVLQPGAQYRTVTTHRFEW